MKKSLVLVTLVVAATLESCSLFRPKIDPDFARDGLNGHLVDSLEVYINAAYKMPAEYTNDFIEAAIRMNTLNVPETKQNIKIVIELLAERNKENLDENWIKEHLTKSQQKDLAREFPDGLKVLKNAEEIKERYPELNDSPVCKAEAIDAHWAYLSGTGCSKKDVRVTCKEKGTTLMGYAYGSTGEYMTCEDILGDDVEIEE